MDRKELNKIVSKRLVNELSSCPSKVNLFGLLVSFIIQGVKALVKAIKGNKDNKPYKCSDCSIKSKEGHLYCQGCPYYKGE